MNQEPSQGMTPEERRNLVIFSSLVSRVPGNLLGRPFPGVLGAMETARLTQGAQREGGAVILLDAQGERPLSAITAEAGCLRLDDTEVTVRWALIHRANLKAFDHVLVAVGEGSGKGDDFRVICGAGSPLADVAGRRLFARHFQRHGGDLDALGELYKELNGIVMLLQQGNPLERLGQA